MMSDAQLPPTTVGLRDELGRYAQFVLRASLFVCCTLLCVIGVFPCRELDARPHAGQRHDAVGRVHGSPQAPSAQSAMRRPRMADRAAWAGQTRSRDGSIG